MNRPASDPAKLLAAWMEWEKGDSPPGKVMADLKRSGMREVLEDLVAARAELLADGILEGP